MVKKVMKKLPRVVFSFLTLVGVLCSSNWPSFSHRFDIIYTLPMQMAYKKQLDVDVRYFIVVKVFGKYTELRNFQNIYTMGGFVDSSQCKLQK